MIQGLSSALTALDAAVKKQNVTGNNIANVNTNGYKAKIARLSELSGGGAGVYSVSTDESQGYLVNTGRSLDLAINGDGYFKTSSGGENIFSRNGSFQLDADGSIVDSKGNVLMEDAGEKVSVAKNGDVFSNGENVGKIDIYDKYGSTVPEGNYEILSGYLEASNVDLAKEIVDQVVNLRYFQANSKTIKTQDEMLGYLVNLKS